MLVLVVTPQFFQFICSNVVIGAGSVVTKDIFKPGVYVGNPAKFLKNYSMKNEKISFVDLKRRYESIKMNK